MKKTAFYIKIWKICILCTSIIILIPFFNLSAIWTRPFSIVSAIWPKLERFDLTHAEHEAVRVRPIDRPLVRFFSHGPRSKKNKHVYKGVHLFFHARALILILLEILFEIDDQKSTVRATDALLSNAIFFQTQCFCAIRLKPHMITIAHAHMAHTIIIPRFLSTKNLSVTPRLQNDSFPLIRPSVFSYVFLQLRVPVRRKSFSTPFSRRLLVGRSCLWFLLYSHVRYTLSYKFYSLDPNTLSDNDRMHCFVYIIPDLLRLFFLPRCSVQFSQICYHIVNIIQHVEHVWSNSIFSAHSTNTVSIQRIFYIHYRSLQLIIFLPCIFTSKIFYLFFFFITQCT